MSEAQDIHLTTLGASIEPQEGFSRSESTTPVTASDDGCPTKTYQALLLVSGFLMIFHVIGINSVFGVFQEYYTSPESNIPGAIGQDALVSLAGTIGTGLTWAGSIFVNPWMEHVRDVRIITMLGVFVTSLGLIMASFNTQLWHLYLTQALLYGIGSSMYYFPIMALTPLYFDAHRGFAMGLILAGSGSGGLVLAPVLNTLISRYGVGWALRILGLWNLAIGIPVALVLKKRPGFGARRGTRLGMGLAKRGTFVWQSLGAFLQAAGNLVPMYYMTTYSSSVLGFSSSSASLVLALNNAVNSVSRVSMGVLADKVGRQNTMIMSVILSALSVLALWYDAPRTRFLAFTILYGVYAGGYNALLPTTITEVFGVGNYAAVNGVIYFVRGVGTLAGAPIAGIILGSHSRSVGNGFMGMDLQDKYKKVVLFDGALLVAASVCVAYVRWLDARDKGRWMWKA
ncbi:major facilitator superfamily domain-containing protein [Hygrophoropsis aurantiaca]|uniref:Major facilitator superfamily domain-containing protein n=1 Tax=Hygrophoropsis aurantiaca TaxID=72124 RepID=A0ACB8AE98_9AGAM|nr:major facilitator superfamily domain-containing protein [Hygrophoropsis aurantiaca]